jgi:hypothetical protein
LCYSSRFGLAVSARASEGILARVVHCQPMARAAIQKADAGRDYPLDKVKKSYTIGKLAVVAAPTVWYPPSRIERSSLSSLPACNVGVRRVHCGLRSASRRISCRARAAGRLVCGWPSLRLQHLPTFQSSIILWRIAYARRKQIWVASDAFPPIPVGRWTSWRNLLHSLRRRYRSQKR